MTPPSEKQWPDGPFIARWVGEPFVGSDVPRVAYNPEEADSCGYDGHWEFKAYVPATLLQEAEERMGYAVDAFEVIIGTPPMPETMREIAKQAVTALQSREDRN